LANSLSHNSTFFPLIPRGGFNDSIDVLDAYIQPYIDRTLSLSPEDIESLDKNSRKDYTFPHALAKFTRSPKKICDEVVNLLFASRDTTAVTLMWLFYELVAKPAIVPKLRAEILFTLGPNKLPTPHDLKNMKFLRQVVNETLRLYPAVPINIRYAVRDTIVYTSSDKGEGRPISIRKGDAIAYSTLAMQRRDDICTPLSSSFPPAEVFAPERWESWTPRPWTYIPFNGGPRICVGQQFALMEIWYTDTRPLQKFESIERVEAGDGEGPQSVQAEIVESPARDVMIRFFEVGSGKVMEN
jgi:cytochrome P450